MPRFLTLTAVLLITFVSQTNDARAQSSRSARSFLQNQQKAQQQQYQQQLKYEQEQMKLEAEAEKQAAAKRLERRNAAADAARKAKEHNREVAKARLANGDKAVVKSEKKTKPTKKTTDSKADTAKDTTKSDAKADATADDKAESKKTATN